MRFINQLMQWYRQNKRDLPWRKTKDPYLIWISEIILQQTRVQQGLPYYLDFVTAFPTVDKLANAKEERVLKLWQGLGYYSRAINMHQSAMNICNEREGIFPKRYEDVKSLRGIGPYTAAAICSFAYDDPYPVVDGNVFRVLGRYFGIETPIDTTKGKNLFHMIASDTMDKTQPGIYNQAIMEFGALQCKPVAPDCTKCPVKQNCVARKTGKIDVLPVKSKTIKWRHRYFNYLVIQQKEVTFLTKRVGKDIWKNLYEYPLIETGKKVTKSKLKSLKAYYSIFHSGTDISIKNPVTINHQLTHQKINATFWEVQINRGCLQHDKLGFHAIINDKISNFPIHRLTEKYLLTKKMSNS